MPRKTDSQTAFNSGEISPRLLGHTNFEKYISGLQTARNVLLRPQGPVYKRNSFKFLGEVKDHTSTIELLRFQYDVGDYVVFELGDQYLRFWNVDGQITSTKTVSGAANNGSGLVRITTSTAHGFSTGYTVTLSGVGGVPGANGTFTIAVISTTTFDLVGSTFSGAYTSGGSAEGIVEVTTPWTESEIPDVHYIQNGNIVYFVHPSYAPRQLLRTNNTTWTLSTLVLNPPPTYESGYTPSGIALTLGATSGTGVTCTAGSAVFLNADVGRQIKFISTSSSVGVAVITGFTSTTVVTVDILTTFGSTSVTADTWYMDLSPVVSVTPSGIRNGSLITLTSASAAWRSADVGRYVIIANGVVRITKLTSSTVVGGEVLRSLSSASATENWTLETDDWTASRGYPRTLAIFENRLMFANTTAQPRRVWASELGLYDGFGRGTDADASYSVDLEAGASLWMIPVKDLVIGTSGGEVVLESGAKPGTITAKKRTANISISHRPAVIGGEAVFLQAGRRKIRSYIFDFETDNYFGDDLTIFAEHITEGLVQEFIYAQIPDPYIFAIDADGLLLAGLYDRTNKIIGWSRITTDGEFENVQSITTTDGDHVFVCVNREIDGNTKRYIELLSSGDGSDRLDAFCMDSYLTYSNPKTITNITKANPGVVTSTSHGFSNGDTIKIFDVVGMTEVNNRSFTVANVTANTFELSGVNTSSYTTYESGGEAHEVVDMISGLDHLEGKTVKIKADGASHPDVTVSSGEITLSRMAAEIVIGLEYDMTMTILSREFDMGLGTMQGQPRSFSRIVLRVHESTPPMLNNQFLPARRPSDNMNEPVALYTGFLQYGGVSWDIEGTFSITDSQVFPVEILSLYGTLEGTIV